MPEIKKDRARTLPEPASFLLLDESWKALANCQGMDLEIFFPGKGRADLRKKAKETCARCVVQRECEDYKLQTDSQYGIWAGKTQKEFKDE